jgi:hypothetical protein
MLHAFAIGVGYRVGSCLAHIWSCVEDGTGDSSGDTKQLGVGNGVDFILDVDL